MKGGVVDQVPGCSRITSAKRSNQVAIPPTVWLLGLQGREPRASTVRAPGDSDTSGTTPKGLLSPGALPPTSHVGASAREKPGSDETLAERESWKCQFKNFPRARWGLSVGNLMEQTTTFLQQIEKKRRREIFRLKETSKMCQ